MSPPAPAPIPASWASHPRAGWPANCASSWRPSSASLDTAISNLRIKVSGCFNSCGQHHVADIGFYGNSRNVGNYTVPHFQVMLGGQWTENGGSYALAMGAVPSKRIPASGERA